MALFEQEFSLADVPLLSKARQNFSVIAYYNKPLVFIVDEISSTRTGEDKYLMKIKYKEDDGINTIELGTHPSLEGAKKFFKTQFLEESPSLVTQVKARANEVEIVGDNDEIKNILDKHKEALITEAITKTSNRVHDVSKIENFSFETLNYSDFSLSVKSFGKSNITHADKKREAYAGLEKLIGAEDTDKIFSIIENIKVDLAEKKKSGFWKENPFNKITNLTLEWSEGSSDTNVQFKSFAELNDWFDKTFRFADDIPGVNEGYVKNKISFSMINDAGETFNTSVRADVSASSGDFNPRRGNIYSYFADKLKYNLDTPRAMANGSSVYVDLSRYKDNAVAFGDEEQKNLFQFTFYNKWDTTIYKQVESWGATQEEAYSSIVAADSHGDEYEGLEDLEYSVEKLDIGVSDIKREFNIAESLDEDGDALYTIGKSDFKISSNSDGIPDMLQAMFEHAKNSEEVVSWISSRELSSTIVDSRGNGFVVSDIADFLDREHERFLQSSAVRSLAAGANSDLAGGEVERLANSGRVNKDLV